MNTESKKVILFVLAIVSFLVTSIAVSIMSNVETSAAQTFVSASIKSAGSSCFTTRTYLPVVMNHPYAQACSASNNYCEDNDSHTESYGPISSGTDYTAYPNDQEDYYYFVLSARTTVTAIVTNYYSTGQLHFRTEDDKHIIHDDYDPGSDSDGKMKITYTLDPGTYHVRVVTVSGHTTETLYTLNVTYLDTSSLAQPAASSPKNSLNANDDSHWDLIYGFDGGDLDHWEINYYSDNPGFNPPAAITETNSRMSFNWENQEGYAIVGARHDFINPPQSLCEVEVEVGIMEGSLGVAGINFRVDEGDTISNTLEGELYSNVVIGVDGTVGFGCHSSTVASSAGIEEYFPPGTYTFASDPGELISNAKIRFENIDGRLHFYLDGGVEGEEELGIVSPIEKTDHIVLWTDAWQDATIIAYVEEVRIRYCVD